MNLTAEERANLETFDALDFEVFSNRDWARLGESHAQNITVGIWNRQGTMDEEFFFWDNQTFYSRMGLA